MVETGREPADMDCDPVTRRDHGRPCEFVVGNDDWRTGGGGDVDGPNDKPPSLDQSKPDEEVGAGDAVREGGLLSNDKPFSGSQLNPPCPVGAPSLCISSSYMRSCRARAMAMSLASSCSAWVLNPSCSCWCTSLPASALLLAHPSVILVLLDAASAMTFRMSTPRDMEEPPSL